MIITRFAPSPTGLLHLGVARTAIFNWLFAKHHNGKFLLRIEDTDRARSTKEATDSILESLKWLEINYDDEIVFQSDRINRHVEEANRLLSEGKAYRCYCTKERLDEMREIAIKEGKSPKYDGTCRLLNDIKENMPYVVRLKMPQDGETKIDDLVQGEIIVSNKELDDLILLRSDQTPTYMMSVVVDDHDMKITHVIRGSDHITNTFRQKNIFEALNFDIPKFAHIPLIHGSDGAKLSKRHGAVSCEQYRDMGFLNEALFNALIRLGWGHGDLEIIERDDVIKLFTIDAVGKSSSRFDISKLLHINAYYMKKKNPELLFDDLVPFLEKLCSKDEILSSKDKILRGFTSLIERSKTLIELAENSLIYIKIPELQCDAGQFLIEKNKIITEQIESLLKQVDDFKESVLHKCFKSFAVSVGVKLVDVAQPIRVALTGRTISPSIFEIMEILGKDETINRLNKFCDQIKTYINNY